MNNGEDGFYFVYSENGYDWIVLNNNEFFLIFIVGKDKFMCDFCIIKDEDGIFYMVWIVSWNE